MAGPQEGKHLRYLFDVTASAQWEGPPVGITRVERELARRARRYLAKDAGFCVYDRLQGRILELDYRIATEVLRGRLRIDFTNSIAEIDPHPVRRRIRQLLRSNATAYRLLQRAKGRVFTREEILRIKAQETVVRVKRLSNLAHLPAALDADTTIISAGPDWNYKDVRSLWLLKQRYRFRFCPAIYGLFPVHSPHFIMPDCVGPLTDYFGELLWVADHAMCVSQETRREWVEHAYNSGAEQVPSSVFPLGCDPPRRAKKPMASLPPALRGKQFAIYVSTIEARKNHRMLYEAWEECLRTEQLDPNRHRLVLVGHRGWATADVLREIEANPLTKETIVLLQQLTDEQLAALYQVCSFVLFPSLYEGFGLALTKALGYGKLCISSNIGALSEIGDDLVMRLDPKDTLLWSHTIGRLFTSFAEVKAWERRIRQQYRPTTWDDAARKFFTNLKSAERDRSLAGRPLPSE